jgi:transcriptional regulator with XRE-family HTH domain
MEQSVSKPVNHKARRKVLRDALSNAHGYIGRECVAYNISVAELCRRAGVERSHFQRWKRKTPRSLETFCRLLDELERAESELLNTGTDVATT